MGIRNELIGDLKLAFISQRSQLLVELGSEFFPPFSYLKGGFLISEP